MTGTTVFFIRHGSHDRLDKVLCGRMAGVGLSEAGRAEADGVARRLAGEGLQAVYTSPLERARQTAEPIAAAAGVALQTDPALNELDFGGWNGVRFEDLRRDPLWARWNAARTSCRPPGGESLQEVQARLARFIDAARARHPGAAVAAVSHAEPIKAALAHALGLPLDMHARLEVGPASVSVVVAGDWGLKVHSMNEGATWRA